VATIDYIEELRQVIRNLHNAESRHVESVSVKEIFQGVTVWEGVVEVFELVGHPTASRIYAWAHEVTGGKKRHVTVLHGGPIDSPQEAVRASIVRDYRVGEES
jgi:hypothetical protein